MSPAIEVEIRSFISEAQYHQLLNFFQNNAILDKEDEQISYYFDSPQDLRIQKNKFHAKIWLKKGKLHDDHREEIEVIVPQNDFEKLETLFLALGYHVNIKWFRTRHQFIWNEITVTVDYTKGYGHILELEIMSSEEKKNEALNLLKQKMSELQISETPKLEFDEKYQYYKEHWQELMG